MKRLSIICLLILTLTAGHAFADSQTTSNTLASVIITNARSLLNESSTTFMSDAQALVFLNAGTMEICKSGVLEDIEIETLVEGTTAYVLTESFIKVVGVIYDDTTPLELGTFEKWAEVEEHGTPGYWMPWETGVIVFPAPDADAAGKEIDCYFLVRPAAVASNVAVLVPAQYDSQLVDYIVMQALFRDSRYSAARSFAGGSAK